MVRSVRLCARVRMEMANACSDATRRTVATRQTPVAAPVSATVPLMNLGPENPGSGARFAPRVVVRLSGPVWEAAFWTGPGRRAA